MTLDEAIKREKKLEKQLIERANALDDIPLFGMTKDDKKQIEDCYKRAEEHRQIAEWLKELKENKDVLNKIRAEIEQLPTKTRTNWDGCCPDFDYPEIEYVDVTKAKLLKIIDKYKAESEE